MNHASLLFEILILLGLTAAGLSLFERLKLPAIAGFLVVGAIAGPGVLGLVPEPERVRTLAEFGVVFLLFEIGLDLPMDRMRRFWRTALLAGGAQVGLTLAIVTALSIAFGLPPATAFVMGALIAISSTALVLRLLTDQAQSGSPHGQLATAILLFQDLSIVPLLLAIPLIAGGAEASALEISLSIGRAIAALAVVLFVVQFAVPRLLDRMTRVRSSDLFSLLALLIVLGSAFLAEELGLTLAVGAFLAGVAAASSPYAHQLFSEVIPLRGVVLGIFFTAIGMLFEPRTVVEQASVVLAILSATIVLKAALVTAICCVLLKQGLRIGILTGLALAQTGEFSFVLAEAASREGLLDANLLQAVIAASILSLLATPFLMRAAPHIADRLTRGREPVPLGADEPTGRSPLDHARASDAERAIVIGFGPAGQTLAQMLGVLRIPYVVVDTNAQNVRDGLARGIPIVFGDATRPAFLERLAPARAKLVAVAISDPLATGRIVARVRAFAPDVPILARGRFIGHVDDLEAAGSTVVVAEEFEGSIELVRQALLLFDHPPGKIRDFTDALRAEDYGMMRGAVGLGGVGIDPWLVDLLREDEPTWVTVPAEFEGTMSLAELDVRARTGVSVVAIDRAGAVDAVPEASYGLCSGDRLLVLGDSNARASLEQLLGQRAEQAEGSERAAPPTR